MRPDARLSKTSKRTRKRGPRSEAARLKRQYARGTVKLFWDQCTDHSAEVLEDNSFNTPLEDGLGETRSKSSFQPTSFTVFHSNIQGFTSHQVRLLICLEQLNWPTFVTLNETLLDTSTEYLRLPGYVLVSRRDRRDGRKGGGTAFFVHKSCAASVVLLEHSEEDERS